MLVLLLCADRAAGEATQQSPWLAVIAAIRVVCLRRAEKKSYMLFLAGRHLGSGLIDHSQKITAAAMQMGDIKSVGAATPNGGGRQSGYRLGGGFEQRIGPLSLGVLYLYTNVKDDDFRVNVTRGTAPATNAFVLTNPAGTQFRFSDKRFETHSANLTASYRF